MNLRSLTALLLALLIVCGSLAGCAGAEAPGSTEAAPQENLRRKTIMTAGVQKKQLHPAEGSDIIVAEGKPKLLNFRTDKHTDRRAI